MSQVSLTEEQKNEIRQLRPDSSTNINVEGHEFKVKRTGGSETPASFNTRTRLYETQQVTEPNQIPGLPDSVRSLRPVNNDNALKFPARKAPEDLNEKRPSEVTPDGVSFPDTGNGRDAYFVPRSQIGEASVVVRTNSNGSQSYFVVAPIKKTSNVEQTSTGVTVTNKIVSVVGGEDSNGVNTVGPDGNIIIDSSFELQDGDRSASVVGVGLDENEKPVGVFIIVDNNNGVPEQRFVPYKKGSKAELLDSSKVVKLKNETHIYFGEKKDYYQGGKKPKVTRTEEPVKKYEDSTIETTRIEKVNETLSKRYTPYELDTPRFTIKKHLPEEPPTPNTPGKVGPITPTRPDSKFTPQAPSYRVQEKKKS